MTNRILSSLLFMSAALFIFGWWGMTTISGRHKFDEMAGMIPLASIAVGALIGIGAGASLLWRSRRR